jgi:CDP-6-deoxy-D-xylo-4-hexulose-3-dehydrase
MDRDKLIKYLDKNHAKVAAVFPTALLGFSPPMDLYSYIQKKYPDIYFMSDNCENTFGRSQGKNISSYLTSTTSTYIGHQLCSIEGGFVFTNDPKEAEYFIMARNHGMTRGLNGWDEVKYRNEKVDKRFDFYCMGSNFRNTEINAFIGLLDFKNINKYMKHRRRIYELYYDMLRRIDPAQICYLHSKLPPPHPFHSPFCLPLVCNFEIDKRNIMRILEEEKIETRPIISGFLGHQTAYKKYFVKNKNEFEKSKILDSLGFYMGLHVGVTKSHINKLEKMLKEYMHNSGL